MSQNKILAILIDKRDFFGPSVLNESTERLPLEIAVCDSCFFNTDVGRGNDALKRALTASRDILIVDVHSTLHRPPRCHICGRYFNYDPLPSESAATQGTSR